STVHGVAGCQAGACTIACNPGFDDCDGDVSTGCETNVDTAVASCGTCGHACVLANATPVCTAGQCAIASCNTGFADCDMQPGDGCEVSTATDPTHCGS